MAYTGEQPKTGQISGGVGTQVLADTTLLSPTASIIFSGIVGTYKHLRLVIQGRSDGATAADGLQLQFNGDTGANYDSEQLTGANITASAANTSGAVSAQTGVLPGTTVTRANTAGTTTINIPNYAGTVFEKSWIALSGITDSTAANCIVRNYHNSWRSTAAITSIKLFPSVGTNLVTGTRATLYGEN